MTYKIEYAPLKYSDGWYITFISVSGTVIKSHGPYKSKYLTLLNIDKMTNLNKSTPI